MYLLLLLSYLRHPFWIKLSNLIDPKVLNGSVIRHQNFWIGSFYLSTQNILVLFQWVLQKKKSLVLFFLLVLLTTVSFSCWFGHEELNKSCTFKWGKNLLRTNEMTLKQCCSSPFKWKLLPLTLLLIKSRKHTGGNMHSLTLSDFIHSCE